MENMTGGRKDCPKCRGTGRIKDASGTIGPCFDCLLSGQMDQHSKDVKDSGIVI